MSRELDAKVAEKVMGEKVVEARPDLKERLEGIDVYYREINVEGDPMYVAVPYYTLVASDDYEVLKHVRETWEGDKQKRFEDTLSDMWDAKHLFRNDVAWLSAARYEPGDYSKAALKALGEEI